VALVADKQLIKALARHAQRAELLTRLGEISRAAAALVSPARSAPPTAESHATLTTLHPARAVPIPPALLPPYTTAETGEPIVLTATDITVALHSCPKGSAPGCDGLTLEHILAAALEDPLLAAELAAVCTLIANGALSAAAATRPLLGAGRLVALLKPDGKLRPIGIPTFLVRRLAARGSALSSPSSGRTSLPTSHRTSLASASRSASRLCRVPPRLG